MDRSLYRLICVFLLLFLAGRSYGSPIGTRKTGRSSVFSLFNLKEKSRFWSENVMHSDFNDLESANNGKMGVLNYTEAGNIANYLKLLEVDSIHLPVPVNFIFIGFEGKGNHEFKLHPEELERWFTKIDHIFGHTRVPHIGEVLTPFYKISIDKVQRHHLPIVSHINYNVSVHAIQMSEKVTSVFDNAINVLARRDDVSGNREDEDTFWQVDVDMMDVLFSSLVDYLQLENAYNIFVLNPKHDGKKAKYGYRCVFHSQNNIFPLLVHVSKSPLVFFYDTTASIFGVVGRPAKGFELDSTLSGHGPGPGIAGWEQFKGREMLDSRGGAGWAVGSKPFSPVGAGVVENSKGPFGPILKEAHPCLFGWLFSSRAPLESIVGALGLEQVELADEDFNVGGSLPGRSTFTDKALMDEASRYPVYHNRFFFFGASGCFFFYSFLRDQQSFVGIGGGFHIILQLNETAMPWLSFHLHVNDIFISNLIIFLFDSLSYVKSRGLSESEINFLKENKDLQTKILQSGTIPESVLALEKIKRPLYEKHPMEKFAWTITEDTDTVEWSNICLDALNNVDRFYQGKDTADIIHGKVIQILKGKNEDMKQLFGKELKSGDLSGIHAECLTDTWIGKDRWAFIDLSAGPFSWGPAVGGEGVRTELSLPNVKKTIGAVAEISEDEAEDRLQDAIQEKFAAFGDKDHQAIDILLAEIDIYELFAFKHCKGRKVKLALCEELDERMRDLKNELQSFEGGEYDESHRRKAVDALNRMESWNLFSDTHEEFQNYTVARDTFLAHLGATLWGSMRHIISPSIADGAFHFYDKISFQLFFITQEKVRHIKQLPVDLKALTEGLSSLLLPSQKAMFSQHMLPLSEDPALAMAFSVARRAAAVPLLLVNGTYRKTIRTYLDSSILQHQLQRLNDHGSLKGMHAHSRSTLEVPIFWFLHSEPLLVDKHYQAKALSDMVIVVQSETSSWESHLQCNGKSLLWDLRRPIKAALAAASEHLAGLLPLHLVYSQAHETAIEDWAWSVGCNPLSITSQGWHISQFQSDTVARSYIITTLEESIQLVNSAIHRLVMEHTTEQTFKLFQSQERDLVNKYNHVVGLWRRIATVTGELRYVDAMRLLYTLEDASKGFVGQVNASITLLHPIHCTRQRKVDVEFDMTTIPAFLIVLGVLWLVLRPRRPKPKIN
ncbi:unnamed protein product, partial [Vitis vinifera]